MSIDSRPSDAIALALRSDAEIFVEEEVLEKSRSLRTEGSEQDPDRLRKWLEEVVLLKQLHVNAEKHDGRTIEQLRADISTKTGENVVIRRFARFQVGG